MQSQVPDIMAFSLFPTMIFFSPGNFFIKKVFDGL